MLRELKLPDRIPNHTKTMACPCISFVLQLLTSVWSLQSYRLQHARHPCSSPSPGACSCMSIESGMPSNHLVLCHPFLLLPSNFPSIRVFSNELALRMRWPNYWSFGLNISLWTIKKQRHYFANKVHLVKALKSLLQHHSSKASVLCHSAFFMVSSSHICTWLLGKPRSFD